MASHQAHQMGKNQNAEKAQSFQWAFIGLSTGSQNEIDSLQQQN